MKTIDLNRLPGWTWLMLPVLALWPAWVWSAMRFTDSSDDPLGIVALAALIVLVMRNRHHFSGVPRLLWISVATGLVSVAVLGATHLPALLRAIVAVLAVCAGLFAVHDRKQPFLSLAGLGLLSLPVLSSLQFYAGYPLRLVTAEATRLLLSFSGFQTERSGIALTVAGRLVMVDAPCSGIHMAWVAYFTAFAAAAWLRVSDRYLVRMLPFVGITVLSGNVVRNSLLVMSEGGFVSWPAWTHEVVGLVVFAVVCALVLMRVRVAAQHLVVEPKSSVVGNPDPAIIGSGTRALIVVTYIGLLGYPWLQLQPSAAGVQVATVEWPREYGGRLLRPLALSAVEQRFADRFPGAIGRFTDGNGTLVLRHVTAPTRMLHPATDCYRGLGYRVTPEVLVRQAIAQDSSTSILKRCFVAERNGHRLRVCEHITDAMGQVYTDTSAWYWAAITGQSQAPWQAITQARPI